MNMLANCICDFCQWHISDIKPHNIVIGNNETIISYVCDLCIETLTEIEINPLWRP